MSLADLPKLVSPKFTENEILEILRSKFGFADVSVKSVRFGEESKKGDSYLSTISRFTIEASGKIGDAEKEIKLSLIVKSLPKNIGRTKTFRCMDFFENENIFYQKVWPTLLEFQNSKSPENIVDVPLFLAGYADGINDYIALEDLTPKGYRAKSRDSKLDYNNAVLILHALAKFHAISLAFKDQNPEKFEAIATSLKETYFAENHRSWYANFQKTLFDIALDAVDKQLPKHYFEKVKKIFDSDLFGTLCEHCVMRGPFSVVAHGDTWIPNFLFQYGPDSTIRGVAIIDFQLTRYTSLSTDLTFFLYGCLTRDVRNKYWSQFIAEYHKKLTETIKTLGSDPSWLTLEALQEDIKNNGIFGVGMALEGKIMSLLDDESVSDVDGAEGDQKVPLESLWIVRPFKSEEKRLEVAEIFKHAADNNFI